MFGFFSWTLAVIAAVTLLWPLNIPVIALAYKVRQGPGPLALDFGPFLLRSTFAALGLALLTLVVLLLDYVSVEELNLPFGPVQFVLLLAYLPTAVWYVFWMFALEDFMQGLSLYVLYVLLAGLPLLIIGRLFGFWTWVRVTAPWLLPPTERAF